jgi:polyhydroxyalkanoate synthesis regulator phasin
MGSQYKKIVHHPNLYKDETTGAIINTNVREIQRARERKEQKKLKKIEDARMKSEVQELRSEIAELKELVKELVK